MDISRKPNRKNTFFDEQEASQNSVLKKKNTKPSVPKFDSAMAPSPMNIEKRDKKQIDEQTTEEEEGQLTNKEEEERMKKFVDQIFDDEEPLSNKYLDVSTPGVVKIQSAANMLKNGSSENNTIVQWNQADQILLNLINFDKNKSKCGFLGDEQLLKTKYPIKKEVESIGNLIKNNFYEDLKIQEGFRYYRSPISQFKKKDSMYSPAFDHKYVLYCQVSIPLKFDPKQSCFQFLDQQNQVKCQLTPEISLQILEEIVQNENKLNPKKYF